MILLTNLVCTMHIKTISFSCRVFLRGRQFYHPIRPSEQAISGELWLLRQDFSVNEEVINGMTLCCCVVAVEPWYLVSDGQSDHFAHA